MERHNIKWQRIFSRYIAAHLYILLGGAITLAGVQTYAYVKEMQVMTLLQQPVNGHRTVNAS